MWHEKKTNRKLNRIAAMFSSDIYTEFLYLFAFGYKNDADAFNTIESHGGASFHFRFPSSTMQSTTANVFKEP